MKKFKEFPCLRKLSEKNYLYFFELFKNINFSHDGSADHIPISEKSTH